MNIGMYILKCSVSCLLVAAVVAESAHGQETPAREKRLDEVWDQCREVWFKGQDLTLSQKLQRFQDFKADRKLSPEEKDCILKVADALLDKQRRSRVFLAHWLGDMGHAYCIPPLLAVYRDKDDDYHVRVACVYALSRIADKRVVDPLIDAIGDDELGIGMNALSQLDKLFKFIGFETTKIPHPEIGHGQYQRDLPWRKQMREKYRQWWQKHRDQIELDRRSMMWDW